jgi:hypothetical protein
MREGAFGISLQLQGHDHGTSDCNTYEGNGRGNGRLRQGTAESGESNNGLDEGEASHC